MNPPYIPNVEFDRPISQTGARLGIREFGFRQWLFWRFVCFFGGHFFRLIRRHIAMTALAAAQAALAQMIIAGVFGAENTNLMGGFGAD